jgi:hypothetical protein
VHTPRQVSKLERPLNASRRFNSAKVENVTVGYDDGNDSNSEFSYLTVVSHRKSVSEGNETSDQVKLAPTGPASRVRRLWSVVWAIQSLFHGARSGPGNLHTFTTLRIRLIERLKLSTYLMGEFSKMMDWRDGKCTYIHYKRICIYPLEMTSPFLQFITALAGIRKPHK